jgi:predicted Zn finger-like uncharacterized protein
MQIVCPTCNSTFKIASNNLPQKRVAATCKNCGGKIVVEPTSGGQLADVAQAETDSLPAISPEVQSNRSSPPDSFSKAADMAILGDYPELRELASGSFDYGKIFSPSKKGVYKTRQNNLKAKIVMAVHELVNKMLGDGETVIKVGKATAFYPSEVLFGNGYFTMMYNHYAVLATNLRLLFVNINSRINRPTHYFFQIPYPDIERVKRGPFGTSLTFHRFHGKKRTFTGLKRYMSEEIQETIKERQESIEDVKPAEVSLENLCPACFMPLAKNLDQCSMCKSAFKTVKSATLKSLLLPGWGDIYLGHRFLGIVELLGSLVVWLFIISLVMTGGQVNLILALLILLFYNGFDALLTHHMAKKGYILAAGS